MDENTMIHRLYTSGVFVGSTAVAPIVRNRRNTTKLYNKTRIKQYTPIHYNGGGRLMSFVILDLLKAVENYGEICATNMPIKRAMLK